MAYDLKFYDLKLMEIIMSEETRKPNLVLPMAILLSSNVMS